MKTLSLIMLALSATLALGSELPKIPSAAHDWLSLTVEKTKSRERRHILKGSTDMLEWLEIHTTTLEPGNAPHASHTHADNEEMIIVKDGNLAVTINGDRRVIGPGSVVLIQPGDHHGLQNAGKYKATYYVLRWRTRTPPDMEKAQKGGGSEIFDWTELKLQNTEKGGRRQIMRRPTVFLRELEMHVTTLDEGVRSHAEHTHIDEEIILVRYGEVEELIDGKPAVVGPGALIFLASEVPHTIRNVGRGPCEYYAFKWILK